MKDMSFLEKLKVLVDVSSSSGLCIATIFILLFLAFVMITTNKKNAKSTKKFYLLVYVALIIVILTQYGGSLSTMTDYMMNNFFIAVYFPNLAIYLAAIIATNIILWKTIFNFKEDKLLKIVNTVVYSIMHYLLVLILNIVTSKKLDVFDKSSIYGNNNALALIGLSSTIFVVWIIFIIIYKIIRSRQQRNLQPIYIPNVIKLNSPRYVKTLQNIKYIEVVKEKLPANILQKSTPRFIRTATKTKYIEVVKEKLPANILQKSTPRFIRTATKTKYIEVVKEKLPANILQKSTPRFIRTKTVHDVIEKLPDNIMKIKNPKFIRPATKVEYIEKDNSIIKQYENMLTLEDYKMVLDILKNGHVSSIKHEEEQIQDNNTNVCENKYNVNNNVYKTKLDEMLNLV